jgi:hypothetical protein
LYSDDDAKRNHLELSKTHLKEALRLYTEHSGPNHHMTAAAIVQLSVVMEALEQIGGVRVRVDTKWINDA